MKLHPDRMKAQREYDAALASQRKAATGDSEAAYLVARDVLNVKRLALIEMEAKHPTPQEQKRAANVLRLRNRGLDI